jgi:CDP-diacylglycerol--glycerol-3-phosphate 3-phosphatidyltransferase
MTTYSLKPAFQDWLRPLVKRAAAWGVTANQVTIAALAGSLTLCVALMLAWPLQWPFLFLPVWFFIRLALNAMDGMLAREHGQESRLGALLNEMGDVISDAALFAPFAFVPAFGPYWIGLVIFLSTLSQFAGTLGAVIGAGRRYEGPLGKSDRAIVFGVLALWVGLEWPLPSWAWLIMLVLSALLICTAYNRLRAALKAAS